MEIIYVVEFIRNFSEYIENCWLASFYRKDFDYNDTTFSTSVIDGRDRQSLPLKHSDNMNTPVFLCKHLGTKRIMNIQWRSRPLLLFTR